MNKCCRTCHYFSGDKCYHPETLEEHDIYTEYIENLFDMGNVIEAVDECYPDVEQDTRESIVATVATVLKNNLSVKETRFSPADSWEFYCSFYK